MIVFFLLVLVFTVTIFELFKTDKATPSPYPSTKCSWKDDFDGEDDLWDEELLQEEQLEEEYRNLYAEPPQEMTGLEYELLNQDITQRDPRQMLYLDDDGELLEDL